MTSYYDKLGISPTASKEEIQAIIDTNYNQVRRLVNHHDPNVVNQANQALLILEQSRLTLLDPDKRAAYDASLGIGAVMVGGVADPSMAGQAQPAPYPTMMPAPAAPAAQRTAYGMQPAAVVGWTCEHCATTNPTGTMFCTSCGKEVGRICPNCQAAYEARSRFCPSCGVPYEAASRRNEITNRLTQLRMQRYTVESQANASSSMDVRSIQYLWAVGGGWAIFLAGTTVLYLLAAFFRLIFGFFPPNMTNSAVFSGIATLLNAIFVLARWAVVGGSLAAFFLYFEKRKGIRAERAALGLFGGLMLLAMLFGGRAFYWQAYGVANTWLIFPALVSGGLFLWAGYTLAQHNAPSQALALPVRALQSYQSYVDQAVGYSQSMPWPLAGAGAGLSLLLLIFSGSGAFVSIIFSAAAAAASLLLAVTAYRAWTLQDIQREKFEYQRRTAQAELANMDAEIGQLEMEINALPAAAARR
jgi:hypothetical protein